jgi:hypothetical protein
MATVKTSVAALSRRGATVRVALPADVAFNLDKFQKFTRDLAERLGCKPCLSGAACWFVLEQDFVVNPAGKIEAGPTPDPWLGGGDIVAF